MTAIAYNHKDKQIAVDGRLTKGSFIVTDSHNKITQSNGVTFIIAGKTNQIDKLVKAYPDFRELKDLDCYGFMIVDGVVKWVPSDDRGVAIDECTYNESAGSGGDFAATAMDMGASASDAVKMACKRDVYSGGDILIYHIETGEIVNTNLATCGNINKHVE